MEKNGRGVFEDIVLSDFVVKDVINSFPDKKSIFLLLGKGDEKALLICNKQAFEEELLLVSDWLSKSKLRFIASNDRFGSFELALPPESNQVKTTFIYPATEWDIQKYSRQTPFILYETPDDYKNITLNYLLEIDYVKQLKWVYNFLEKKSEADRIVFEDDDKQNGFVLAPDLKWNGSNIDELYLLAIVNRRDLRSVRDLTVDELPLLENIRDQSAKLVKEKYGLGQSQLKMYFHYQPTFYHLHVHVVTLKYEAPGWGGFSILLQSAIDNIKNCANFYKKATLPFVGKEKHSLTQKFFEAGRV
ncbi:hypothetical protein GPALN_003685 [Globodera pallida]|nr:hypothetical protein GPALN_003685 [Globodera pallida]